MAQKLVSDIPSRMEKIANEGDHSLFLRVLVFCCLWTGGPYLNQHSVSFQPHLGKLWRNTCPGEKALIAQLFFSALVLRWNKPNSGTTTWQVNAHINDPVNEFRILLRHAAAKTQTG